VRNLVPILQAYGDGWIEMGQRARQAWLDWFSPPKQFNYVIDSCADIMRTAKVAETPGSTAWPLLPRLERSDAFARRMPNLARRKLRRVSARHAPGGSR